MPDNKVYLHSDLVYQAQDMLDLTGGSEGCTVEFDSAERTITIFDVLTGEVLETSPWIE